MGDYPIFGNVGHDLASGKTPEGSEADADCSAFGQDVPHASTAHLRLDLSRAMSEQAAQRPQSFGIERNTACMV
jgi:hypothetical protein